VIRREDDDLQREALALTGGDPDAAAELLAAIAAAEPPVAPPPRAKARLLARIAAEPPARAPSRVAWWTPVAAAIAAALVVAVLLRAPPADPELARLRAEVAQLRASGVRAMAMEAREAQAGAKVEAFWDRDAARWFVVGSGLKRMRGKDLQFWFITDEGRKVPSQMLDVHDDGCGMLVVTVPSDLHGIVAAAITDEPRGGSPQPTGQVQLLAKLR
jgi:anti-sigma-K factor RskA